jgi:2-phospho-L-lactate transferase/gluconeogenesis factor (CofD/UPF0052 family)
MRPIAKRLSSLHSLVRPLTLTFVGIVLLSLGVTSIFLYVYRTTPLPDIFSYLMLRFLPLSTRGFLLILLGLGILIAGIWNLSGIVVIRLREDYPGEEVVLGYERQHRPPHIVVLSGGAGMLLLASLGEQVERVTCITPVQDPVEYYYRASSLVNNQNVYYVVPTPTPAKVYAELDNGIRMNVMHVDNDQSLALCHVVKLELLPVQNTADGTFPLTRLAREAIRDADAIVLGPGSLYESIVPNLLLDELRTAIQQSNAPKIYICNLMTEPGLTAGYSVGDHIRQIKSYGGFTPDYVLVNVQRIENDVRQIYAAAHQVPVYLVPEEYEETTVLTKDGGARRHVVVEESVVIESDLASSVIQFSASINNPEHRMAVRVLRHDPEKLAAAIIKIIQQTQ